MIKVLFVCHGNICRSTMAQFLFAHIAKEQGWSVTFEPDLDADFYVDSAATSTEEIGNPVDPRTAAKLKEHNVDCGVHYARQITRADYKNFDLILLMDRENEWGMRRIISADPDKKIHLILEYAENSVYNKPDGKARDVADPWYTRNFEQTYQDLVVGCEGLLRYLTENDRFCNNTYD